MYESDKRLAMAWDIIHRVEQEREAIRMAMLATGTPPNTVERFMELISGERGAIATLGLLSTVDTLQGWTHQVYGVQPPAPPPLHFKQDETESRNLADKYGVVKVPGTS